MRSTRIGVLVCFLALTTPAWPQQGGATPQQPTSTTQQAASLLRQSLTAMVGAVSVIDVTLTGKARRVAGSDDDTGSATAKALVTGPALMNLGLSSGPRTDLRTTSGGDLAGQWSGSDGKPHAISQHNMMTDPSWFFPPMTLTKWLSSQNYSVALVGQETKDGAAVQHLTVVQPSELGTDLPPDATALVQHLSQMDIYLDAASDLPVALTFTIHPDNNALLDIPVEVSFSGYQSVSGVKVPLHVLEYINNSLFLDLEFNSLALNTGLTTNAFQLQ